MMQIRIFSLILLMVLWLVPARPSLSPLSAAIAKGTMMEIEKAISSIEAALDAIEEIQVAETLEEAQELAAQAEQDLREAIDELEDIEIPNWLWLSEQGALYWHGPILDKETEQPVQAKVYINGHLIAQAQEVQLLMWATEESPFWVEVRAEGYKPWGLRFRFHLRGLEVMRGPIWLVKEG